jgi:hypothetical protein
MAADNDFDFEDDDDTQESGQTQGDTAGVKNLRKVERAQKKQLAEMQTLLDGYLKKEREANLATVFEAKGVPQKAVKFYHDDDVSEDAINKWFDEYGDVLGIKPAETAADTETVSAAKRVATAAAGANSDDGFDVDIESMSPDEYAAFKATW